MLGTNARVPTLAMLSLLRESVLAPTGVSLTPNRIDQGDPDGSTVGTLTAIDATPAVTHTFTVIGSTEFQAVGALLKTDATFVDETYFFRSIQVKVENSAGESVTKPVTVYIDPTDTSNDTNLPPDPPVEAYGVFPVPPFVGSADGVIKLSGKNGGVAKIIIDIGVPKPGKFYKMKYRADWSQLSNHGKEAFVGYGFIQNEDFHFGGLKGDGASGVRAATISGVGKLHGASGFTYTDLGPVAYATQSGPNFIEENLNADGSRYAVAGSNDDGVTFAPVLADRLPAPLGRVVNATTHGIAIFLENSDKGPFVFQVDVWESNAAGYGRGYGQSYGGS